jgi:glycosyltransferase involved in cell wall biosynthesis
MVFYGIEPLAAGYAEACVDLGVQHRVVYKKRGADLRAWRRVVGAIQSVAPDVVLLHSMSLVVPVSAFARARRTPLIAIDHLSNQVKLPRDWMFAAAALALADRTITLTDEFASELRERLWPVFSTHRVATIGNGIDLKTFAPRRPMGAFSTTSRVGMHGRFSPSKDHATLLRAAVRLPQVRLVLPGAGETFDATRRLARDLGIEERVEFPGTLPEGDLPGFLQSLDVYVQSSKGETMSTAVMQAMACGLPILASDVKGLRNMIHAGETGELFQAGNDRALAVALKRLASDHARSARLGRNAVAYARSNWSLEHMFSQYEVLMKELVSSKRRS